MNEQLRKKLIFVALGLAIVWAAFNVGSKKSVAPTNSQATTILPLSPVTAGSASAKVAPTIDTLALIAADWGDDPFHGTMTRSSRNYRSTPVLSWKLTGIMYSHNQPLAYINHKMVKIGDLVDNARVVTIDRDTVTLEHNNRTITLTVSRG